MKSLIFFFTLFVLICNATHEHKRVINIDYGNLPLNYSLYGERDSAWICVAKKIESTTPEIIIDLNPNFADFMQVSTLFVTVSTNITKFPSNGEEFVLDRCFLDLSLEDFIWVYVNGVSRRNTYRIPHDAGHPIGAQTAYTYLILQTAFNLTRMKEKDIEVADLNRKGVQLILSDKIRPKSLGFMSTGIMPLPFPQFTIPAFSYSSYVTNIVDNPAPHEITCSPLSNILKGIDEWFAFYGQLGMPNKVQLISFVGDNRINMVKTDLYIRKAYNATLGGSSVVKLPTSYRVDVDDRRDMKNGGWLDVEEEIFIESTDGIITECFFNNRDINFDIPDYHPDSSLSFGVDCNSFSLMYDTNVTHRIANFFVTNLYNTHYGYNGTHINHVDLYQALPLEC